MWRKGKTVTQFGIYGGKEIKPFLGSMPSHSKVRSIPRIAFYDEIWAKKRM